MTENGEGCVCEVWCGKGDADSIKERCYCMFRTVTVLDLGLECCQMLELGVDRGSALQGSQCTARQVLHIANSVEEEFVLFLQCLGVAHCFEGFCGECTRIFQSNKYKRNEVLVL